MKWRISFEIELPTESHDEARDWARFEIGFNGNLSGTNPCSKMDLPANWEELDLNSLRVTRS